MGLFGSWHKDESQEAITALAAGKKAEQEQRELYAKSEAAYKRLSELKDQRIKTALAAQLSGDMAADDEVVAQIAAQQAYIAQLDAALKGARRNIEAARAAVEKITDAERAKALAKILKRRDRAFVDRQKALAAIQMTETEIHEANAEICAVFPPSEIPPDGLIFMQQVTEASIMELLRIARPDPVNTKALPLGVPISLLTDPSTIRPLLEIVTEKDNYLLELLSSARRAKPLPEGAEPYRDGATMEADEFNRPDPDADLLEMIAAPAGQPNVTEAMAMSLLPRTQGVTIDHRANKGDDQ